jgi:hypothetical protein
MELYREIPGSYCRSPGKNVMKIVKFIYMTAEGWCLVHELGKTYIKYEVLKSSTLFLDTFKSISVDE